MEGVSEEAILQGFLPTPGLILGTKGNREGTRASLRRDHVGVRLDPRAPRSRPAGRAGSSRSDDAALPRH